MEFKLTKSQEFDKDLMSFMNVLQDRIDKDSRSLKNPDHVAYKISKPSQKETKALEISIEFNPREVEYNWKTSIFKYGNEDRIKYRDELIDFTLKEANKTLNPDRKEISLKIYQNEDLIETQIYSR